MQAESITAAALLHAHTGQAVYDDWREELWDCSWQQFVDPRDGAWHRVLSRDNRQLDDDKSPAGKTNHHTMGTCHELLRVL